MQQTKRIAELDYLKFVFITLMIAFHLVYIGDTYPQAKSFVYTFHMPGFLLISGYVLNRQKGGLPFLRAMLWLFVPYALMETAYVVMAALLPIREHVSNLSAGLLLSKLCLHPLGPYWYLHTLILCSIAAYFPLQLTPLRLRWRLAVVAAGMAALSLVGMVDGANAFYFFAGVMLRQSGRNFIDSFHPTLWALLPVGLITAFLPNMLNKSTLPGLVIVWCMISFLLWTYSHLKPEKLRLPLYIGRNTLLLLLFSPVFTMLAKYFQAPLVSLDPTGILFLLVALPFATGGSLAIGWISDKLCLSRWLFGSARSLH